MDKWDRILVANMITWPQIFDVLPGAYGKALSLAWVALMLVFLFRR